MHAMHMMTGNFYTLKFENNARLNFGYKINFFNMQLVFIITFLYEITIITTIISSKSTNKQIKLTLKLNKTHMID